MERIKSLPWRGCTFMKCARRKMYLALSVNASKKPKNKHVRMNPLMRTFNLNLRET